MTRPARDDGSEYLAGGDAARLEQTCSAPPAGGSHEAMCRTGDRCRTSGGDEARQVFVQYTIEYNRLGDDRHDTSSLRPVYRALLSASSASATECARDMEAAACGEADGPTPGSPGVCTDGVRRVERGWSVNEPIEIIAAYGHTHPGTLNGVSLRAMRRRGGGGGWDEEGICRSKPTFGAAGGPDDSLLVAMSRCNGLSRKMKKGDVLVVRSDWNGRRTPYAVQQDGRRYTVRFAAPYEGAMGYARRTGPHRAAPASVAALGLSPRLTGCTATPPSPRSIAYARYLIIYYVPAEGAGYARFTDPPPELRPRLGGAAPGGEGDAGERFCSFFVNDGCMKWSV